MRALTSQTTEMKHICTHIHTHTHIQAHMHTYTHTHTSTHTCSHTQKLEGKTGLSRPRMGGTASTIYKTRCKD